MQIAELQVNDMKVRMDRQVRRNICDLCEH